ncbi:MAG: hypothetical protein ABL897_12250, partial [Hyphomicrobium sp.]
DGEVALTTQDLALLERLLRARGQVVERATLERKPAACPCAAHVNGTAAAGLFPERAGIARGA